MYTCKSLRFVLILFLWIHICHWLKSKYNSVTTINSKSEKLWCKCPSVVWNIQKRYSDARMCVCENLMCIWKKKIKWKSECDKGFWCSSRLRIYGNVFECDKSQIKWKHTVVSQIASQWLYHITRQKLTVCNIVYFFSLSCEFMLI